jgi:hypothetical protein
VTVLLQSGQPGPLQASPGGSQVAEGGAIHFLGLGGTPPYSWSLAMNASGGGISAASGAYVAGSTPGTDYVVLTDSATPMPSSVQVTVSVLAPVPVSITSPTNGATVSTLPLTVSGTTVANMPVNVKLDGNPVGGGGSDPMGNYSFQIGQSIMNGSHTLEVDVQQGPSTGSAQVTFTYTPAAQSLTLLTPADGAMVATPFNFTGTANAGAQVTVTFMGMNLVPVNADGGGNWSVPMVQSVPPGMYPWMASSGAATTPTRSVNITN